MAIRVRSSSAVVLLAACLFGCAGAMRAPAAPPPVVAAAAAARPAPVAVTAAPVRLDLPVLRVSAPIVPVAVGPDGLLGVPDDPRVLGWWRGGAALVLDGHVDSAVAGPGALFRLAALVPGDALALTTADGTRHAYTITTVRAYPKSDLPPDVFAPARGRDLLVVSCGGHFDHTTRRYADNIVVAARAA